MCGKAGVSGWDRADALAARGMGTLRGILGWVAEEKRVWMELESIDVALKNCNRLLRQL